ncbi:MAG: hypothetical protein ACXAEF_04650, partial [Candidatus Thorarchaeota archaeon]
QYAYGIALDSSNQVYVVGGTKSRDFPIVQSLSEYSGEYNDGFIVQLNADGDEILYSSYVGGDDPFGDTCYDVVVDNQGLVYIFGTTSSDDFPLLNPIDDVLVSQREVYILKMSLTDEDPDGDGLSVYEEEAIGTDPNVFDTDGDSLGDGDELNIYGTDPLNSDTDSDDLGDGAELTIHLTDPLNNDTDSDGLLDGPEINTYLTDPLSEDSDEDGIDDYTEIHVYGTDPNSEDTDSDGFLDLYEIEFGTDPLAANTNAASLILMYSIAMSIAGIVPAIVVLTLRFKKVSIPHITARPFVISGILLALIAVMAAGAQVPGPVEPPPEDVHFTFDSTHTEDFILYDSPFVLHTVQIGAGYTQDTVERAHVYFTFTSPSNVVEHEVVVRSTSNYVQWESTRRNITLIPENYTVSFRLVVTDTNDNPTGRRPTLTTWIHDYRVDARNDEQIAYSEMRTPFLTVGGVAFFLGIIAHFSEEKKRGSGPSREFYEPASSPSRDEDRSDSDISFG